MSPHAWSFSVALTVIALTGCQSTPDFRAYCEKAAPCESEDLEACVSTNREIWYKQKESGCEKEGAALLICKTKNGKCEERKPNKLYMPTENCRTEQNKLTACLRR